MGIFINFTKREIDDITPSVNRLYYHDTKVDGLTLVVYPSGAKSFQIYKKISGKPIRHTLGKYPDLAIERARKMANEKLAEIAEGVNPNEQRRVQRNANITVAEVFTAYLAARRDLKPGTILDYNRLMASMRDIANKPMRDIDKDAVAALHNKLGKRSKARANNAMRLLRALFNFATIQYEDERCRSLFPDNPVDKLSQSRAWFVVRRRQTVIKPDQVAPWFAAVNALTANSAGQAAAVRDVLLLYLFHGLRLTEGLSLRVKDVDLRQRSFTLHDPKNRESITIPLSTFTHEILTARLKSLPKSSVFVFPANSKTGYLTEPKEHYRAVREASGVYFTPHDLRRTFTTIAESMDISSYTLKRLLNHKISQSDVTAGYIITDVERLRDPVQRISNRILDLANRAAT